MLVALYISFVAAVIPTIIYALLFYWADRYEREPWWLVGSAFLWGAVPAVIVSLIGELTLGAPFINAPGSLTEALVEGAVVAPVVEEIVKALALLVIFVVFPQEFDGPLDGLIYGALIGFGFAMTENFLYFVGAYSDGGFGQLGVVIILRTVVFGLNHAFYTGLTGLGLGLARNARGAGRRIAWGLSGLVLATLVHSLHNLGAGLTQVTPAGFLLSLIIAGAGLGLVIIVIVVAWRHERECIREELADEVDVCISRADYTTLISRWQRPLRRMQPAARAHDRLLQQYVELALRKRRLRRRGYDNEPELVEEIATLRAELLAQSGSGAAIG